MVSLKINGYVFCQPLSVLFDSGSRFSYISPRAVPVDVSQHIVAGHTVLTLTGERHINRAVDLTGCTLPQLSPTLLTVRLLCCYANKSKEEYDIILRRDALFDLVIGVSFSKQSVT